MMYNYPFFSFPHFGRYSPYYSNQTSPVKQPIRNNMYPSPTTYAKSVNANRSDLRRETHCEPTKNDDRKEKSLPKKAPIGFSFLNNFLHQEDRDESEEFFNIFGLKLYHDDILLLGLIFFLYQEEVKDQYLFFALILLLLS